MDNPADKLTLALISKGLSKIVATFFLLIMLFEVWCG